MLPRITSLSGSTGWNYHDGVEPVPLVLLIVYIEPTGTPLSVDVPRSRRWVYLTARKAILRRLCSESLMEQADGWSEDAE